MPLGSAIGCRVADVKAADPRANGFVAAEPRSGRVPAVALWDFIIIQSSNPPPMTPPATRSCWVFMVSLFFARFQDEIPDSENPRADRRVHHKRFRAGGESDVDSRCDDAVGARIRVQRRKPLLRTLQVRIEEGLSVLALLQPEVPLRAAGDDRADGG